MPLETSHGPPPNMEAQVYEQSGIICFYFFSFIFAYRLSYKKKKKFAYSRKRIQISILCVALNVIQKATCSRKLLIFICSLKSQLPRTVVYSRKRPIFNHYLSCHMLQRIFVVSFDSKLLNYMLNGFCLELI